MGRPIRFSCDGRIKTRLFYISSNMGIAVIDHCQTYKISPKANEMSFEKDRDSTDEVCQRFFYMQNCFKKRKQCGVPFCVYLTLDAWFWKGSEGLLNKGG